MSGARAGTTGIREPHTLHNEQISAVGEGRLLFCVGTGIDQDEAGSAVG